MHQANTYLDWYEPGNTIHIAKLTINSSILHEAYFLSSKWLTSNFCIPKFENVPCYGLAHLCYYLFIHFSSNKFDNILYQIIHELHNILNLFFSSFDLDGRDYSEASSQVPS